MSQSSSQGTGRHGQSDTHMNGCPGSSPSIPIPGAREGRCRVSVKVGRPPPEQGGGELGRACPAEEEEERVGSPAESYPRYSSLDSPWVRTSAMYFRSCEPVQASSHARRRSALIRRWDRTVEMVPGRGGSVPALPSKGGRRNSERDHSLAPADNSRTQRFHTS